MPYRAKEQHLSAFDPVCESAHSSYALWRVVDILVPGNWIDSSCREDRLHREPVRDTPAGHVPVQLGSCKVGPTLTQFMKIASRCGTS